MINLLPPENRRQIHAMKQNSLLIRYVIATAITLLIVIAIHVGTFVLLKTAESSNKSASSENQARVNQFADTQKAAQEYSTNLAIAKEIFSKRVPYTDAIINLASMLPPGVVLDNVTLDQSVVDQPGTLTARAKSYDAGLALKDTFNRSDIAKDVSIASVSNDQTAEGAPSDYPFSVTLNITFTDKLLRPTMEDGNEK